MNELIKTGIKREPDGTIQCHQGIADLQQEIKKYSNENDWKSDLEIIEFDERKWKQLSVVLKEDEAWKDFESEEIKDLLEDIAEGTINGHSFIKYKSQYIDPYLTSLDVPQEEINKLDSYLNDIYKKEIGKSEREAEFAEGITPSNKAELKLIPLIKKAKQLLQDTILTKVNTKKERKVNEKINKRIEELIRTIILGTAIIGGERVLTEISGKKIEAAEFCETIGVFAEKEPVIKPLSGLKHMSPASIQKRIDEGWTFGSIDTMIDSFNTKFTEAIDMLVTSIPVLATTAEELREYYRTGFEVGIPVLGAVAAQTIDQVEALQTRMTEWLETGKRERIESDLANILNSTNAYAETVFRTVTSTAYSIGRQIQQKPMIDNKFIVGFEYLTADDGRVRGRPGGFYKGSDENHWAFHHARIRTDNPILNGMMPPNGYNCYDKETEILTDKGWRLFSELKGKEKILSLNPETKDLEWVKAVNYICQTSKKMFHFKHKSIDLCVTPNHQMLICTDWNHKHNGSPLEFRQADKISKSNCIYKSSEWKGKDKEHIKIGDKRIKTELYCKLLGYYLSEGSISKNNSPKRRDDYTIKISQKDPTEIYEDIKDLPYKLWLGKEAVYIKPENALVTQLMKFGKSYKKYVPKEIKGLSPKYIRIFLDAYLYGDGRTLPGGKIEGRQLNGSNQYYTSSNKMANDLGELIIKVGKGVTYYKDIIKGKRQKFSNGKVYTINHNLWRITETKTIWQKILNVNIIENYNDFVYCVELEKYHTLFVRRNGRTAWCGNCRCILRAITRIEAKMNGWLDKDGELIEYFPPTFNQGKVHPGFGRRYNV